MVVRYSIIIYEVRQFQKRLEFPPTCFMEQSEHASQKTAQYKELLKWCGTDGLMH